MVLRRNNHRDKGGTVKTAYKLLTKRKDNTLGPLFINRKQRIPIGSWLRAEPHPTKGYKFRPFWHVMEKPEAPHLREGGNRVWCEVQIDEYTIMERPEGQGGVWYLANEMRVIKEIGV